MEKEPPVELPKQYWEEIRELEKKCSLKFILILKTEGMFSF